MSLDMLLTPEHVKDVCKSGQGKETCSFVAIYPDGISCAKNTDLEPIIRNRLGNGIMKAKGDNCDGKVGFVKISKVF